MQKLLMPANKERHRIKRQFGELLNQPKRHFPELLEKLDAPSKQGVYIIYKGKIVLHVGRTLHGKNGLSQRLENHLAGASSFTIA